MDGGEGDTIRVAGRKTQGVRLFEVDGAEKVVSVGVIRDADTGDEEEEGAELVPDTSSDTSSDVGESAETTSNNEGSA